MASTLPVPAGDGLPAPIGQIVSYAGLGRRVAAYVIDLVIGFSVLMAAAFTTRILLAAGLVTPIQATDPVTLWRSLGVGLKVAVLLAFVLAMGPIYFVLFESSPWQATFGKRVVDIRVTGDDGQRVNRRRACVRWIARFFCGLFGGSLASLVLIATTQNQKAVHDHLAHTLVLRGRPTAGVSLGPWRVIAAFGLAFLGILGMYIAVFSAS
jgi:uncharacterized RDD family membrane protein YckC